MFVQHCASYDSQVAEWMWSQVGTGPAPEISVPMRLSQTLRYGENPHQSASFYTDLSLCEFGQGGVATSVQHHGKEMSYNNYLDADAAYSTVCDFPEASCVIVKHTNPCGAASRDDILEAYRHVSCGVFVSANILVMSPQKMCTFVGSKNIACSSSTPTHVV